VQGGLQIGRGFEPRGLQRLLDAATGTLGQSVGIGADRAESGGLQWPVRCRGG
jgi:hypothetical protein